MKLFLGQDSECVEQQNDKNLITDESLNVLTSIFVIMIFIRMTENSLILLKNLTKQTASMGNKALGLVNILNEAERIKIQMVQKEIDLGLE